MSRSLNRVQLLGRLGKDAETKFTPSGAANTTFSVATDRSWKDKNTGEWKNETDWHNIVAWRMENVANLLLKGTQVYVEGRLQTRSYDDRDGNKRYVTEVVADNIILCGGKGNGEHSEPVSMPRSAKQEPKQTGWSGSNFEPGITDDDIPF